MITIAIVFAAFVAGLAAGVIALLRAGIAREESDHTLLTGPTSRSAMATRRVVGLYVRTPRRAADDDVPTDQFAAWLTQRPPPRPGQ